MWHGCQKMACRRFSIEIDQSTNMTKFTSFASRWGAVIVCWSCGLWKCGKKTFTASHEWFGVWQNEDITVESWQRWHLSAPCVAPVRVRARDSCEDRRYKEIGRWCMLEKLLLFSFAVLAYDHLNRFNNTDSLLPRATYHTEAANA